MRSHWGKNGWAEIVSLQLLSQQAKSWTPNRGTSSIAWKRSKHLKVNLMQ